MLKSIHIRRSAFSVKNMNFIFNSIFHDIFKMTKTQNSLPFVGVHKPFRIKDYKINLTQQTAFNTYGIPNKISNTVKSIFTWNISGIFTCRKSFYIYLIWYIYNKNANIFSAVCFAFDIMQKFTANPLDFFNVFIFMFNIKTGCRCSGIDSLMYAGSPFKFNFPTTSIHPLKVEIKSN